MALIDDLQKLYPGYSPYEIGQAYAAKFGMKPDDAMSEIGADNPGAIMRGIKQGGHELAGAGLGLMGLATGVVGAKGTRDSLMGAAQEQFKAAQTYARPEDEISNLSWSNAPAFAGHAIGNLGVQMLPMIAGGGVASMVAKRAGTIGVEAAVNEAVAATVPKLVAQGLTEEAATKMATEMAIKSASVQAAGTAAASTAANAGLAGSAGAFYGQNVGSIYADQDAQGIDNPGQALAYALPATAAGMIGEAPILAKMFKGIPADLLAQTDRGFLANRAIAIPRNAGLQAAGMAGQTAFMRGGADRPMTGDEAMEQYKQAGLMGGLVGGVFGGVMGGNIHRPAGPEAPTMESMLKTYTDGLAAARQAEALRTAAPTDLLVPPPSLQQVETINTPAGIYNPGTNVYTQVPPEAAPAPMGRPVPRAEPAAQGELPLAGGEMTPAGVAGENMRPASMPENPERVTWHYQQAQASADAAAQQAAEATGRANRARTDRMKTLHTETAARYAEQAQAFTALANHLAEQYPHVLDGTKTSDAPGQLALDLQGGKNGIRETVPEGDVGQQAGVGERSVAPAAGGKGAEDAGNAKAVDADVAGKGSGDKGAPAAESAKAPEAVKEPEVTPDAALPANVVTDSSSTRKAVNKPALDRPMLLALRQGLSNKLGAVRALFGTSADKVTGALERIHDLTKQRETLMQKFAGAKLAKMDDGEYTAQYAKLQDVTKELAAHFEALEGEVGANNLHAAQSLDKGVARKGQSHEATRFSTAYKDLNRGALSAESPMEPPTSKAVRERTELGSMTDTKLASAYHSFKYGKGEAYTGVQGVIMKARMHSNSPFTKQLASALYHIFKDAKKDDPAFVPPEIKFYTDEGLQVISEKGNVTIDPTQKAPHPIGRFDADTNTIHLGPKGQNYEVALHEVLHSALSGYIERNPTKPAVVALENLRQHVSDYIGKHPEKFTGLDKTLIADIGGKDGLHEFLSYGLTNKTFMDAMKDIPQTKRSKVTGFLKDAASAFATAIRRILGITEAEKSAFTQFLHTSGSLLETGYHEPPVGKSFDASTVSLPPAGKSVDVDALPKMFDKRYVRADSPIKAIVDLAGYSKMANGVGGKATEMAVAFHKAFPAVARWVSYIDHEFGLPDALSKGWKEVEQRAQYPTIEANALAAMLDKMPPIEQQKVMDYLNGKTADIDPNVKEYADNFSKAFKQLTKEYAVRASMDDVARKTLLAKLDKADISDLLIYVTDPSDTRGRTMSTAPIKSLMESKRDSVMKDVVQGADLADDGGRFYQLIENKGGVSYPAGFIHETLAAKYVDSASEVMDRSAAWFFKGPDPMAKDNLIFTRNISYKEAAATNKAATHATAIRNTVDHMDRVVSSSRYAEQTVEHGTDNGLVYASRDELLKEQPHLSLPGNRIRTITEAKNAPLAEQHFLRRSDQWIEVPADSKVYGAMAGKFVNGSVWGALEDIHYHQPAFNSPALNAVMRWFKKSKTTLSPGTHVVNVGSNVGWAYFHDIPVAAISDGIHMYYKAMTNPSSMTMKEKAIWQAFKESGALIADYSSAELRKVLSDAAMESLHTKKAGLWGMTQALAAYEKAKASRLVKWVGKADEVAQQLYAGEDNAFRLAGFMSSAATKEHIKGSALDAHELLAAGRDAATEFLDYNIHARGVNFAKQTVIPFISWPYRAIPAMMKIALYKPWKLAGAMGALAVLDAAAVSMTGGESEDKRRRSKLPGYMNDRLFGFGPHMYIQQPGMGTSDKPVYFKYGGFIPAGDLIQNDSRNGFMGLGWLPSQTTPNGPMVAAIAGAVLGVDPFTGQKLSPDTASQWEAFKARAQFLEGQVTPPALDIKRGKETWNRVVNDKHGPLGGEYDKMIEVGKVLGLRFQQTNIPEAAAQQNKAVLAIQSEYKKEIVKITRDSMRFPTRDAKALQEQRDALLSRMKDRIANVKNLDD